MAKFSVYCSWQVCKVVEIEAETAEEAVQKANDDVGTDDGEYVDSSFEAFVLESEEEA